MHRSIGVLSVIAATLAACVPAPQPDAVATVDPAACGALLLQQGSALAQEVAAPGRSLACSSTAPGGSTGTTLVAEGPEAGGPATPRLMAIVMRSEEPLGASAAMAGNSDGFVAQLTGGSNPGNAEPVQVPAATTIRGHEIALRGFSMQRDTDPARYVCVAASDRTSETTIAVVCRTGAGTAETAAAQRIVADDLPGIQW